MWADNILSSCGIYRFVIMFIAVTYIRAFARWLNIDFFDTLSSHFTDFCVCLSPCLMLCCCHLVWFHTRLFCANVVKRVVSTFRWTLNMLKDKNDVTTEMLHETMLRFLFIKWFMITNYKMKENRSVSVRFDFVLMFVDLLLLFNSLWLSLFKRHKFAPNYQNKAQRSINMTIFKLCIEAIQSSDFNINIEYCCKCV